MAKPISEAELDAIRRMIASPSAAEEDLVELLAPLVAKIDLQVQQFKEYVDRSADDWVEEMSRWKTKVETLEARLAASTSTQTVPVGRLHTILDVMAPWIWRAAPSGTVRCVECGWAQSNGHATDCVFRL